MLYCENCQVLCRDEERCPACGSTKLRLPKPNDPVMLLTVGSPEAARAAAAFDDEGIPHLERNISMDGTVVLGKNRLSQVRLFVPYGEIQHASDLLHGIGILKEKSPSRKSGGSAQKPGGGVPISRGKQLAGRILSAFIFLFLICLAVGFSDGIVAFIKSFFR